MVRGGIRLLEVESDLLDGLDGSTADEARGSAIAPVRTVEPGEWSPKVNEFGVASGFGLLIVSGFLARRVALGERWCVELLGTGDVLQPWLNDGEYAVMPFEPSFTVLERLEVAVLDDAVAEVLCRWPTVMRNLLTRVMERSRHMAGHLALTQFPRVETRLHVLLWHLGERFGRMTPEGVVVRLPLSHEIFGGMIAARRPTVTTALGHLREQGLVSSRGRYQWVLHEEPQEFQAVPAGRLEVPT